MSTSPWTARRVREEARALEPRPPGGPAAALAADVHRPFAAPPRSGSCQVSSGLLRRLCPRFYFLLTDVTPTALFFWFSSERFAVPLPSSGCFPWPPDLSPPLPACVPRAASSPREGLPRGRLCPEPVMLWGQWEESARLDTHLLFLSLH